MSTDTPLPYETAKALKEAGWPQPVGVQFRSRIVFGEEVGAFATAWAYSPTLEELIAVCPREFNGEYFCLYAYMESTDWCAGYGVPEEDGSTPKEAIANLVLAGVKAGWITLKEVGK